MLERPNLQDEAIIACLNDCYGRTYLDPVALAYDWYEWVVQEFGDYGVRVFIMEDVGDKIRGHAVGEFISLFQPGDVVEKAYNSSGLKSKV